MHGPLLASHASGRRFSSTSVLRRRLPRPPAAFTPAQVLKLHKEFDCPLGALPPALRELHTSNHGVFNQPLGAFPPG